MIYLEWIPILRPSQVVTASRMWWELPLQVGSKNSFSPSCISRWQTFTKSVSTFEKHQKIDLKCMNHYQNIWKISWISSKNQPQPVRCHFSWRAAGTGFHELDGSSVRGVAGSCLFLNSQIQLTISWQMTTGLSLHLKLDSKIWLQNFWSLH